MPMVSAWIAKCLAARKQRAESLGDVLVPGTALRPDAPAIFFEERRLTYRELDDAANRVATALVALGVAPGDRVGIHLDNRPEFVEAYQGVMRAGATLVPANVMYTAEELRHIFADSGAVVVFVRSDLAHKVREIRKDLPALKHVVEVCGRSLDDSIDFEELKVRATGERPSVEVDPQALAFIQYTSGTTGKPKGAMVTHANVLAVIDNTLDMPGAVEVGDDDAMLLVLPLFHAYALNLAMNRAFLLAMPFVLVNRFDAEAVFRLIEHHRITTFYGAPPMYFGFVNTSGLEKYDVSSLRAAFSGAAPLPVVILERFKERTGVEICEGYG